MDPMLLSLHRMQNVDFPPFYFFESAAAYVKRTCVHFVIFNEPGRVSSWQEMLHKAVPFLVLKSLKCFNTYLCSAPRATLCFCCCQETS